ncbi:MAG TPA: energy transducer TonB [Nitrospiria bacterium]|nr:energy transducer TonB [Nitrospiria bacterium]
MRRTRRSDTSSRTAPGLAMIVLLIIAVAGCAGTPDQDAVTIPASRIEELTKALATRVDRPPIPKGAVAHPYYPDYAMRRPKPGMVLLKIDVDAKGRVAAVQVVESTNVLLESAARQAALQWSFEPAMRHGLPVAATIVVPVEFTQGAR